jgi:hypothetical protein
MPRSRFVLPLLLLLAACEASLADREKEARAALDARDFTKARLVSEEALASSGAGADAATAWRLEQIRLEALAQEKQGAEIVASLARLSGKYGPQITPALYRSLADKLKTAGDTTGAIDVLAAGHEKFPQEAQAFVKDIDALKQGKLDPAQIEKLKALGYL